MASLLNPYLRSLHLELVSRLSSARAETDRLFSIVRESALYDRPIPERHRIVFYIGHLEAFDLNLLGKTLGVAPFHVEFDRLFAFGIDPTDGNMPNDQPGDWPTLRGVEEYRQQVRDELDKALAEADETVELRDLLNIAIEHRLMHAETLEYMFHQLPYESKTCLPSRAQNGHYDVRPNKEMVAIPEATVTLGMDREAGTFGWDNEFSSQRIHVDAFLVDKYKVTNEDFLEFVKSGGYQNPAFWRPADWEWRTRASLTHPAFWTAEKNGGYRYRSMFEEIALPLDAPVFVSYAEAAAYAQWAGKRLPTEAEWQLAAEGAEAPTETRALWDPPGVGVSCGSESRYGVSGLYGTGWEWTSTLFEPFPGFEAHPAYPGYSANFFDGGHYVMKGGSTRTAAELLRKSFRNWFQPHYQYVYAGFRCVAR